MPKSLFSSPNFSNTLKGNPGDPETKSFVKASEPDVPESHKECICVFFFSFHPWRSEGKSKADLLSPMFHLQWPGDEALINFDFFPKGMSINTCQICSCHP